MEDVAAAEPLRQVHFFQADDAGCVDALAVRRHIQVDTREALQLRHKRSGFDEQLGGLVQLDERVKAFAKQVERELAAREEPEKEPAVQ